MADRQELDHRFTYHAPEGMQEIYYQEIRALGKEFAERLDAIIPSSRELSLAQTKIEEAVMWANAGIARRT